MNSFICDECREAGYSSVVGVTVPIVSVKKSAQCLHQGLALLEEVRGHELPLNAGGRAMR